MPKTGTISSALYKWCYTCGAALPRSEFSPRKDAHDGLRRDCRLCENQRKAAWRRAHPRDYNTPAEREKARQRKRRYNRLRPDVGTAVSRRWRAKNPAARRAHEVVKRAVARGELVRPNHCERCQVVGPVDGHHGDYFRPLDVQWLCRQCHADAKR